MDFPLFCRVEVELERALGLGLGLLGLSQHNTLRKRPPAVGVWHPDSFAIVFVEFH